VGDEHGLLCGEDAVSGPPGPLAPALVKLYTSIVIHDIEQLTREEKSTFCHRYRHSVVGAAALLCVLIASATPIPALPAVILAQSGGNAAPSSVRVSFRGQIQPIFDANCVVCHQSASAQEGLILEDGKAHANLVGQQSRQAAMALVTPGSEKNSYLLYKIGGTQAAVHGRGSRMPLGGQLSAADIDILRAWVVEGAQDN
jgi:mono/diheme cytochrome c family protein